jgi:ATP-dependent helicase YprA (DUF1998 family)
MLLLLSLHNFRPNLCHIHRHLSSILLQNGLSGPVVLKTRLTPPSIIISPRAHPHQMLSSKLQISQESQHPHNLSLVRHTQLTTILPLFNGTFMLRRRYAEEEHNVTLSVPMYEPVHPNYYISVISDRWLHAETRLAISFKHLIVPKKFPKPTPLLDLQALPLSALHNKEFEALYANTIQTFNKIQTQVFQALYTSDENVFIGAPTGSGKTICAEFALLRLWSKPEQLRAVCIEPYQEMVDLRVKEWTSKFRELQGGKEVVSLTGETSADLRLLEKGDVIICTPSQVSLNICP